jgi:hypothetical protein
VRASTAEAAFAFLAASMTAVELVDGAVVCIIRPHLRTQAYSLLA